MGFSEALLHILGPFPEKTRPEPSTLDSIDCGTYIRELIEFSVEEKERISAYVLVPKGGSGRYPAVYCHHQHAGQYDLGKSEVAGISGDPSQAYARELAERGFVSFAPDAIAFEDRNWGDASGGAAYYELASRLVRGQTLLAKVLHDVSMGVDYLCSRDDVDSNRIGFLGHSYGGRMAIWAAAFDGRIRASVSHCGCVSYRRSLNRNAGIQLEFCVPGILDWGDLEDVVAMIAPRSLLISATEDDRWSVGAKDLFNVAKAAFPEGALQLAIYPGGHTFSANMRQRAYEFLEGRL